jgi:hypothetical protein
MDGVYNVFDLKPKEEKLQGRARLSTYEFDNMETRKRC